MNQYVFEEERPVVDTPAPQPEPAPAPVNSGFVFCSECGHKEPAGVKFCSECGTKLQYKNNKATQSSKGRCLVLSNEVKEDFYASEYFKRAYGV